MDVHPSDKVTVIGEGQVVEDGEDLGAKCCRATRGSESCRERHSTLKKWTR